MNFEDLTPEQQDKARACKTPEELVELAEAEGVELSDEQLENISGGWYCCTDHCGNVCPHYQIPCSTLH